ncbi:alpha/beta fold hydrolase [Rathayibacter iranicus]|uniref:Alpha/beta hydrolase n=3 Tax=Rathayibacter iranicus TaxID=59737 RepID=A0AAD1AE79_9MICO|nr:alpha/beta hydrolase [Rathayibacter iranicus]AZZ56584.1 alpha/beta hydrolase [Rathayibacter iranicus]MWV32569.1 alpha/beta fold hydrolase [Rathayibacter iranicus NCPPB 2253 = VKM Ac-1602]PPI43476.1 alpha/beta hydrolase [Rathayibacter iranicus]PPI58588.1 alpha/beta hydrolase [Rathayibacter iranicus]PPI69609.1 alpha/beta hydrolase [Rathayibacter iranicus]
MATIDVHSTPVYYTASGSGPGLLFVHGTAADGESNFGHIRDMFSDRYTVITPDFSGSGRTPLRSEDLSVDDLVDQVVGAAQAVTDEPFDIVGFSLGAVVAAAAAAKYAGKVRRLIIINGWARNDDPRQQLTLDLWQRLAQTDEGAFSAYSALLIFSPPFLSSFGSDGVKATVEAITADAGTLRQIELDHRIDIRDRLPAISSPALVIGSTRDVLIPIEHARELHDAIQGSEYAELESGHMVVFEKTEELVHLISEFLDRA